MGLVVKDRKLIKALETLGYRVVRQKSSHVRMHCATSSHRRPTTIPLHGEIKPGTLRSILRDASLTIDELRDLL